jgi:pilus assembly protein CpaB
MNRNRFVIIGLVALALGALVATAVYRALQTRTTVDNRPGADVVIAVNDLPVGAKIGENDVKLVRLPAADLPPNCYHQTAGVVDRGVVLPIQKGEFILPSKLSGKNVSGLPSLIPPGMRAVSVRVNEVVSVAGFVQPGTRVDVLLTGNPNGGAEQQTTTVLENVSVIASGSRLERNANGETSSAPVITLLVSPEDAQRLTLASKQGAIQLSLRNPLDTQQTDLAAARSGGLYKIPVPLPVSTIPKSHVKTMKIPPPPQKYSVEIYKGDKKDVQNFDEGQPQ